jgi:hypothetical protein
MSTLTLQGTPFTRYPDPLVPPFSPSGFSPNNVIDGVLVNVVETSPGVREVETRTIAALDEVWAVVFSADFPAFVDSFIDYGEGDVYLGNVAVSTSVDGSTDGQELYRQARNAGAIETSPLFDGEVPEGQAVSPTGSPWVKGFSIFSVPVDNNFTVDPSFGVPAVPALGTFRFRVIGNNALSTGRAVFSGADANTLPAFISPETLVTYRDEIIATGCIEIGTGDCLLVVGVYAVVEHRDPIQTDVNGFTEGGGSQILLPIVGSVGVDVQIDPTDCVRVEGTNGTTYTLPPIADVPVGKTFYISAKVGKTLTLQPTAGEVLDGQIDLTVVSTGFIVIKMDPTQAEAAFALPPGTESWKILMASTVL